MCEENYVCGLAGQAILSHFKGDEEKALAFIADQTNLAYDSYIQNYLENLAIEFSVSNSVDRVQPREG